MNDALIYSVTLSWNRKEDTLACLRSLRDSDYPNLRAVLVDNASTDDTVVAVHAELPEVTTLVNSTNLGYAAGVNVGLRHALEQNADFVLILDNDATIAPDALTHMMCIMHSDSTVGLLTPKILFYNQPDIIWCTGHKQRRVTLAAIDDDLGKHISEVEGAPRPRDYAPCCGLLIRRSVLENVGLLEEKLFIYYEDLDFCIRAGEGGYKLLNVPDAKVWHNVSASAGSGSPLQRYYLARSSVHFYLRHTPGWLKPLIVLYRAGSAVRTVSRALLHKRTDVARAYLQGLKDGIAEAVFGADIARHRGLK